MMRDTVFQAEAKKLDLELDPFSGNELRGMVSEAMNIG